VAAAPVVPKVKSKKNKQIKHFYFLILNYELLL
jgi:transglutaminase/protease-like cytokinesis protein 3